MIGSHTNWIGWTLEFVADRCAFQNAKRVWLTWSHRMTIIIWCAIWNRWFFAHWAGWIPCISGSAMASWIWISVQSTFFIQTACNWRTRIDAFFVSIWSNNANLSLSTFVVTLASVLSQLFIAVYWYTTWAEIIWIANKTVAANTCWSMIIWDTQCIWSAWKFTACINAISNATSKLEANFSALTILIDFTLTTQVTTFAQIICIADVTQWANTFSKWAGSSWTAWNYLTQIQTMAIFASISGWASNSFTAHTMIGIIAITILLNWWTHCIWISVKSSLAFAVIAAGSVNTNWICSTWIVQTFIDIATFNEWISIESDRANTFDASVNLMTFRSDTAFCIGTCISIDWTANFIWISYSVWIANTFIRNKPVTTVSILTTSWLTVWIFVCCFYKKILIEISFSFNQKKNSVLNQKWDTYVAYTNSLDFHQSLAHKYICQLMVHM